MLYRTVISEGKGVATVWCILCPNYFSFLQPCFICKVKRVISWFHFRFWSPYSGWEEELSVILSMMDLTWTSRHLRDCWAQHYTRWILLYKVGNFPVPLLIHTEWNKSLIFLSKPEIAWMKSSFTATAQYISVSSLVCRLCAEEWLQ